MNIVDQVYMALIYVWSVVDKLALSAGVTAVVVAILRMRKRGKVLWSEALLCGVFATVAIIGLQFLISILGIPTDGWVQDIITGGNTVIGAAIGWYGTDKTVTFIEDKVGGSKDDTDSEGV